MGAADVTRLAALHFLLSAETGAFLDDVPNLLRRLPTASEFEEERSNERVRGAVQWPRTFIERVASGTPTLLISRPSQRAYQTPENQLLAFLLTEIVRLGKQSGWMTAVISGPADTIRDRVNAAIRWSQSRMLAAVEPRLPTPRSLARVRTGRHRHRFRHALHAWAAHQRLVEHLDRQALRAVIEREGLVTRTDSTLFELLCLFNVIDALEMIGWAVKPLGLIEGGIRFAAYRSIEALELWYQRSPAALTAGSIQRQTLIEHKIAHAALRPDIVLRHHRHDSSTQWLLIEAKMGRSKGIADYARAALFDLLAYRTAFAARLTAQTSPFGLGVAWGSDLVPANAPIMLASPDRIDVAIVQFLTHASP
jgi:hypothetical protein